MSSLLEGRQAAAQRLNALRQVIPVHRLGVHVDPTHVRDITVPQSRAWHVHQLGPGHRKGASTLDHQRRTTLVQGQALVRSSAEGKTRASSSAPAKGKLRCSGRASWTICGLV